MIFLFFEVEDRFKKMIVFSAESLFSITNRLYEIMQMLFLFIVCGVQKNHFKQKSNGNCEGA